jgi:nicotinamidase-related amidase
MNKALIIVDMLNDFVREDGALYCGQTSKDIISHIQAKLVNNRKDNNLIIYLQDCHDLHDLEFDRFPPHAIVDTPGNEVISELAPEKGDTIIKKKRYSGFYKTNLDTILKKNKISVVEIVGVCTSICIMDTVGGLANRDIKTIIPFPCVADFDQDMHKMALKRMRTLYGSAIMPI